MPGFDGFDGGAVVVGGEWFGVWIEDTVGFVAKCAECIFPGPDWLFHGESLGEEVRCQAGSGNKKTVREDRSINNWLQENVEGGPASSSTLIGEGGR